MYIYDNISLNSSYNEKCFRQMLTERIRIHDLHYSKLGCLHHEDGRDRFSEMSATNYPFTPNNVSEVRTPFIVELVGTYSNRCR